MASLQVEKKHVCTAGIIYWDLLITSASCACHLEFILKRKPQRPTAVLGNVKLINGHRYIIHSAIHHSEYICFATIVKKDRNYKFDVGIVRVSGMIMISN